MIRKAIFALALILCVLPSSIALSVSFQWIELTSDNRETGWYLQTGLALNNPINPTVEYSWDGVNFHPMTYSTWGTYEFYNDNVTDRSGISPPTDFNGETFTFRAEDGAQTIQASGTVNTIRQIDLSKDVTFVRRGVNPIISWSNSDSNISEYRIRVLDESEELLWQDTLPYEENPTYKINGFTFARGEKNYIRIEGRQNQTFVNISGDTVSWFMNLNRSVILIPYSANIGPYGQVQNPGFEQGEDGWFSAQTSGTICSFTIDPDAFEGSNAAKLNVTNSGYCMLGNSTSIPILRTGPHTLKVYAKKSGDIDHLTLAVWKSTDPNTNPDIPVGYINQNVFSGDYELQQLTIDLNSGEYIRLELGFQNKNMGPSDVLFDNVELTAELKSTPWMPLLLLNE